MAIVKWGFDDNLFSQLNNMQEDMNSLWSRVNPDREAPWSGYRSRTYPPINIYDDGESYVVQSEIPGLDPKSLDVEVSGDTLTIKGERNIPELPEGASYHRRERDYGEFSRSLTLPDRVNSQKVEALYRDGILDIRLPHAEEAKMRKISIKAS